MQNDERDTACHWMLLRLAGRLPDGLLTQSREWLARGMLDELARAVTHEVVNSGIDLDPDDLDLLEELHERARPTSLLDIRTSDIEPLPRHGFSAERPAPGSGQPASTTADPATADPATAVADAVVAASAGAGSVRAVWRSWRFPLDDAPWPPPRQLFVVETDEGVGLPAVTAALQDAAASAGETDPQVEVYPTQFDPPTYQQLARSTGVLLWARDPDREIRIAAVFDEVDEETGPRFRPDHPVVDDDERDRLTVYLSRGVLLMESTGAMDDVWDASAGRAVPLDFRTDGYWVWSDATTYYLYEYGLAPEPAFLEHIRDRRYVFEEVDGAGIHRALAALEAPTDEEPVWQLE